jgi:hypothetical protein
VSDHRPAPCPALSWAPSPPRTGTPPAPARPGRQAKPWQHGPGLARRGCLFAPWWWLCLLGTPDQGNGKAFAWCHASGHRPAPCPAMCWTPSPPHTGPPPAPARPGRPGRQAKPWQRGPGLARRGVSLRAVVVPVVGGHSRPRQGQGLRLVPYQRLPARALPGLELGTITTTHRHTSSTSKTRTTGQPLGMRCGAWFGLSNLRCNLPALPAASGTLPAPKLRATFFNVFNDLQSFSGLPALPALFYGSHPGRSARMLCIHAGLIGCAYAGGVVKVQQAQAPDRPVRRSFMGAEKYPPGGSANGL